MGRRPYFQVPERVGVYGAGEGRWAPSSPTTSHPAYHRASLLWNTLLPCTGGHIKKRDQRTEPERKREREGGQEGLEALQRRGKPFGASQANPKKMEKEERQTERKPDLRRKEGARGGGGGKRRAGKER